MVDTMNIYIYPNSSSDNDLALLAEEALETATNQTIDYFSRNGEQIDRHIEIVYDFPNIDDSAWVLDDLRGVAANFRSYRNTHEGGQRTGEHLLVRHGIGAGLSISTFGGAWRNPPMSIATVEGNQTDDYFKSLCIHEAYHNFLNIGSPALGGKARSEHILGEVIPTGGPASGKQTPMVNGYLDRGLAAEGECNSTSTTAPYTMTLSDCTLEQTLYSYRNQGDVLKNF